MNKNNEQVRMAHGQETTNNAAMSEEIADALFAQATDLAYRSFEDVTDDHIECVYFRLVSNHRWGLGEAGAVTVH